MDDSAAAPTALLTGAACNTCGSVPQPVAKIPQKTHEDLVRSVVLNDDFVVSGSYDHTVKVRILSLASLSMRICLIRLDRYGIGRLVRSSPICLAGIPAGSSVSDSTMRRYAYDAGRCDP